MHGESLHVWTTRMAPYLRCQWVDPRNGDVRVSPARLSSGSRLVSLVWLCLAGVLLRSTVTVAACPNPLACPQVCGGHHAGTQARPASERRLAGLDAIKGLG